MAGCSTRKHAWTSKKAAKRAARQTETNGDGVKVGRIDVYRCRDCGLWHVGHDRFRRTIRTRETS